MLTDLSYTLLDVVNTFAEACVAPTVKHQIAHRSKDSDCRTQ